MRRTILFAALIFLGYSATAFADIDSVMNGGTSIKAGSYVLDTGNGQAGEEITYEVMPQTKSSSLGTCTMNPQASAGQPLNFILNEPEKTNLPIITSFVDTSSDTGVAQLLASSGNNGKGPYDGNNNGVGPNGNNGNGNNGNGNGNGNGSGTVLPDPDDETPNAATPEPGTLLILGIGAMGLLPLSRRYRRK